MFLVRVWIFGQGMDFELGMFFMRRNYFFIVFDETINKALPNLCLRQFTIGLSWVLILGSGHK